MKNESAYIMQTAEDYDMSFIEVKNIYKNHKGKDFYITCSHEAEVGG